MSSASSAGRARTPRRSSSSSSRSGSSPAWATYAERGLLSYYDLELVKGAYGNLILFSHPDGPARWGENPVHKEAVEISPRNYHEIRLHQGTLPGGLLEDGELQVTRTRYIDYSGPEVWRAVRRFA